MGFSVAAGGDRFGERVKLGGEPNDCKVSGKNTEGAMCVFEFTGKGGWPRAKFTMNRTSGFTLSKVNSSFRSAGSAKNPDCVPVSQFPAAQSGARLGLRE